MNDLLPGRFQRAAGSSRVQVVVLAAARLRALHLDPLLGRRPHKPAARRTKNDQTNPLPPAPSYRERLRLRLAKILLVITIAALALRRR